MLLEAPNFAEKSRLLRIGEDGHYGSQKSSYEVVIGIHWSPAEFLSQAAVLEHPGDKAVFDDPDLAKAVFDLLTSGAAAVAANRAACCKKWITRASELKQLEA